MYCEKCGARTHRDDAMNRRCNGCEHLVRQCICGGGKMLEELAQLLNDIVMNPEEPTNPYRLERINNAVYDHARKEAGVTASDLADEAQENSPRIRLYWQISSTMLAQVYMRAAEQLTMYEGWNR